MREHMGLFRGKRIDNGEWVEGYYVHYKNSRLGKSGHIIFEVLSNGEIHPMATSALVDPSTIGECTSLKDKNGKLIFEGDIVRICDRGHCAEGIVVFENSYPGGWLVADMFYKHKCSLAMRTDVEIIGAIHDNPELLKGGEGE